MSKIYLDQNEKVDLLQDKYHNKFVDTSTTMLENVIARERRLRLPTFINQYEQHA